MHFACMAWWFSKTQFSRKILDFLQRLVKQVRLQVIQSNLETIFYILCPLLLGIISEGVGENRRF